MRKFGHSFSKVPAVFNILLILNMSIKEVMKEVSYDTHGKRIGQTHFK